MSNKEELNKKEVERGFLLLGIGSLLSWNTILSQLDFFINYQKEYHPEIVYGNINFLINLITQFLLLSTKKIFSYKLMFYTSLILFALILMFFPYITIYFPSEISFKLSCLFIFINGLANAIICNSMFGLVSFFPIECVIATGAGQGISGILMTIIRYVILLTLNPETSINLSAYIFFGISSFIILIIIRKIMLLYQNEYFLNILIKIGEIKSNEKNDNLIENEKGEELKDLDKINEENNNENKEKEKNFGIFYLILKIFDINFFVILCFVVTIGLFPGVSIRPNLFGMSIGWKINTIIFLFNLFDTFGRKLLAYVKKPTKFLLYFVSFLRLIFLFTFPLVIYLEKYVIHNQNIIGILAVLNVSLMALSSGFVVNLCFSLAPEQVENNLKAKAGSCVSLCLSIGLFFGAFAANVINNIINKF